MTVARALAEAVTEVPAMARSADARASMAARTRDRARTTCDALTSRPGTLRSGHRPCGEAGCRLRCVGDGPTSGAQMRHADVAGPRR